MGDGMEQKYIEVVSALLKAFRVAEADLEAIANGPTADQAALGRWARNSLAAIRDLAARGPMPDYRIQAQAVIDTRLQARREGREEKPREKKTREAREARLL